MKFVDTHSRRKVAFSFLGVIVLSLSLAIIGVTAHVSIAHAAAQNADTINTPHTISTTHTSFSGGGEPVESGSNVGSSSEEENTGSHISNEDEDNNPNSNNRFSILWISPTGVSSESGFSALQQIIIIAIVILLMILVIYNIQRRKSRH
jgi:hypothetical protein